MYPTSSSFIQQAPVAVAMFDFNMCHKFVSDVWKKTFKLGESHAFIGKSHYDVYPHQQKECKEQHQKALSGQIVRWSTKMTDELSNEIILLEYFMHPWYNTEDGSIGGIIIYVSIIELIGIRSIITDKIKSQENLKETDKKLISTHLKLEQFTYACTHDLKEPLRSIANFSKLLFNRHINQFDEESLLHMRCIIKGIDRMRTLIDGILSYSEVTCETAHEKTLLNINSIVSEIHMMLSHQFSEIGAQLNVRELPTISGIENQINQLFTNLISNALKFRSKTPLMIDISVIDKGSFFEFRVSDNGIGIEEEYHKSIFNVFTRLHSKSKYEGSGIGLSTCQKIVNGHQGEIYVQSVLGEGSDFIFTLPK